MDAQALGDVVRFFSDVEDPRVNRTKAHSLENLLMITLVAVLGGANAWTEVEMFGKSKREWFAKWLDLPNGIPSHDTFGRVFARLEPAQLNKSMGCWVAHLAQKLNLQVKTIAIDGKCLRRSGDAGEDGAPLHLLQAWAQEARLMLGQLAVDDKSNEITAMPELLGMLDVNGCVVTVDALHTQKDVAQAVLDRGGDYVMALKSNQEKLHEDAVLMLAEAEEAERGKRFLLDDHTTEDDGHGRLEIRRYTTLTLNKHTWRFEKGRWPGLKAIGRVERERTDKRTGERKTERVYYVMSKAMDIRRFGDAVRGHWGIENSAHWVLDVTFNEDNCRCRKDHSDENFAMIRRLALNLLTHNRERSGLSMKAQRLKIGWDIDFLSEVLQPVI